MARESLAESILVSIDLFEIFELLCRINDPVDLPFIVVIVDPDLALAFLNDKLISHDLLRLSITRIDNNLRWVYKMSPGNEMKMFLVIQLH